MKLSQNKTIKTLAIISKLALGIYVIFLIIKLLSVGAPAASNSIKAYSISNLVAKPKQMKDARTLEEWFSSKLIIQPTHIALVDVRFKTYAELFSLPALLFQLSQLIYWLSIGYLLLCTQMLFHSFSKDKVFTSKNANVITSGALVLLALPISKWFVKESFVNCISSLRLHDSNYTIQNLTSISGSETFLGFALLAFGLAFREGVNLKNENETFI